MSLICVPLSLVPHVWKPYRALVDLALQRGNVGTEIEDVESWLFTGAAQLWLAPGGVAITQLTLCVDEKRCVLVAFTGNFARCVEHLADLERFAYGEGCSKMVILGRKGWRRRLSEYREPYIILEKGLR